MLYRLEIVRIIKQVVAVEADTLDNAMDKVREQYPDIDQICETEKELT